MTNFHNGNRAALLMRGKHLRQIARSIKPHLQVQLAPPIKGCLIDVGVFQRTTIKMEHYRRLDFITAHSPRNLTIDIVTVVSDRNVLGGNAHLSTDFQSYRMLAASETKSFGASHLKLESADESVSLAVTRKLPYPLVEMPRSGRCVNRNKYPFSHLGIWRLSNGLDFPGELRKQHHRIGRESLSLIKYFSASSFDHA